MARKISWVVLTFNRPDTVREAMQHNMATAGRQVDELIWVDNGSHEPVREVMRRFGPDVAVLNSSNLGVAKGYNRGVVLATGDLIVITGCDRKMPEGWLATFERCFDVIPHTGVVSCYSQPIDKVPERHRAPNKSPEVVNGLEIIRAMPMGAKCFPRDLLTDVGHLREDFGLYGWEDVEWGYRYERVCNEKGWLFYTLPGFISEHLGNEGIAAYNGREDFDYHAFKQKEANDPKKSELMTWCREHNFPYYTPYA